MHIELETLPNLILAALVAAPSKDAAHWARQIRIAAETAEMGVVARELKVRLPTVKSIETEWSNANGDNGASYVDWLNATVTFIDGRTLILTDNGLCDMGEYLFTSSSGEDENAPWIALVQDYEQANPDACRTEAEEHALAQAFAIDVDEVAAVCSQIWELIFFCETQAQHSAIELDTLISDAKPETRPTTPAHVITNVHLPLPG